MQLETLARDVGELSEYKSLLARCDQARCNDFDKVNRIVPGDIEAALKAYGWALQNPHLQESLSVAGKAVELQPA